MTLYELAKPLEGLKELPGGNDHPYIQWCLSLCGYGPNAHDETPWCSAMVNELAFRLKLPRSNSAAARSWLLVGTPIEIRDAEVANDVVILSRGEGEQPGPAVIHAPGHVGIYCGKDEMGVYLIAGNQGNAVSIQRFPYVRVLGMRRIR